MIGQWFKQIVSGGAALRMLLLTVLLSTAVLGGMQVQALPLSADTPASAPVVVIPLQGTIDSGLEKFTARAIREAEQSGAAVIVFEINTLGGSVEAAVGIGEWIRSSQVPTIAFVHGKAISAGSYIALNANQIVMEPGSSMGAASVVDVTGNAIEDPKTTAFWVRHMRSAAELRGRDPLIAEGMADKNTVVPMPEINRTVEKGEIVSLTPDEAVKVGYAEKIASSMDEVIQFAGAEGRQVLTIEVTAAENLARFLTNPWVSLLLLIIGLAGIAMELIIPGFGVPGILGVLGFGLYFFGHYLAGAAGMEDIVLFAAGTLLLVLEIFIPSFGILGILGIGSLIASVIMAAGNTKQAGLHLTIAFFAAVVFVIIMARIFKHRGIWNRFILRDRLTSEEGYNSAAPKLTSLLGQEGTAITPLRPSGTALIGDEKVDVVTEGAFIPAGQQVTVVKVEGVRVVVRMKD